VPFFQKNYAPRGSVRVTIPHHGSEVGLRVATFQIFALTAGGVSYVGREIVRSGEQYGGNMSGRLDVLHSSIKMLRFSLPWVHSSRTRDVTHNTK